MKAQHAVDQVSEFITKHWKILTVFALIISSMNGFENKQANFASAQAIIKTRLDDHEKEMKADRALSASNNAAINEKLSEIKVLVNRIDERTLIESARQKSKF